MTNDEKILKALEHLQTSVSSLQTGQERLEKTVTDIQKEQIKFKRSTNRKLNGVKKDIELVLKYHDEMHLRLRERVERLEENSGINQN